MLYFFSVGVKKVFLEWSFDVGVFFWWGVVFKGYVSKVYDGVMGCSIRA